MRQLELFRDQFTIKMSLHAYINLMALKEHAERVPELCDENHYQRMHKQHMMWKHYAYMAGCHPMRLVKQAERNGII